MPKPQPWYVSLNQPSRSPKDGRYRRANTSPHSRPADRADPRANDPTASWTTISLGHTIIYTIPEPKPPTIPYAGVRAGELIGHRLWLVLENNQLCSIAHHFIWEPEAVVVGEVDKPMDSSVWFKTIWGGTYSFRDGKRATSELMSGNPQFPTIISFDPFSLTPFIVCGIALGTIKCWGEVIEHEHGYRAQYAKLTSIQQVIGAVDITALRERYKV